MDTNANSALGDMAEIKPDQIASVKKWLWTGSVSCLRRVKILAANKEILFKVE